MHAIRKVSSQSPLYTLSAVCHSQFVAGPSHHEGCMSVLCCQYYRVSTSSISLSLDQMAWPGFGTPAVDTAGVPKPKHHTIAQAQSGCVTSLSMQRHPAIQLLACCGLKDLECVEFSTIHLSYQCPASSSYGTPCNICWFACCCAEGLPPSFVSSAPDLYMSYQ